MVLPIRFLCCVPVLVVSDPSGEHRALMRLTRTISVPRTLWVGWQEGGVERVVLTPYLVLRTLLGSPGLYLSVGHSWGPVAAEEV